MDQIQKTYQKSILSAKINCNLYLLGVKVDYIAIKIYFTVI